MYEQKQILKALYPIRILGAPLLILWFWIIYYYLILLKPLEGMKNNGAKFFLFFL